MCVTDVYPVLLHVIGSAQDTMEAYWCHGVQKIGIS